MNLFTCSLGTCISSLGNVYSNTLSVFFFLIGSLVFLLLNCQCSLYILDSSPLSKICKYFPPCRTLSLHFVDGFVCSTKVLNCGPNCIHFVTCTIFILRNCCQMQVHKDLFLYFLLWALQLYLFPSRYMTHLELIYHILCAIRSQLHSFGMWMYTCPNTTC